MEIAVNIPKEVYALIKHNVQAQSAFETAYYAIQRGTVLPEGHGRLGDLDTLYREIETNGWFDSDDIYSGGGLEDILLSASTLIEADKGDNE